MWQQVLHLGSGNLNQQQREDVQPSLPHSQLRRRGQFRLQQPQQLLQRLSNGHCPISTNLKEEENAHHWRKRWQQVLKQTQPCSYLQIAVCRTDNYVPICRLQFAEQTTPDCKFNKSFAQNRLQTADNQIATECFARFGISTMGSLTGTTALGQKTMDSIKHTSPCSYPWQWVSQ